MRPGAAFVLSVAVLALVTAGSSPAAAEDLPGGVASAERPRIGLVLAGGGAKGGAHVGVLKVLEELRVRIDCIAGTSMGALVGGGYASGMPLDAMEEFLLGIDWKGVVGGVGRWRLKPIEQKLASDVYSNQIEAGIVEGSLQTESGLVDTNDIENLLRQYVARARSRVDFDDLPIPFRAVATDMLSGEPAVLGEGDLATALRASMAIPGAFAPVLQGDMILADGGMVRNIPVDVGRDLCADVVIVVDLVEDPPEASRLRSAAQLLSRSTDVMFEVNEKVQLASLGPSDILISVPVGDIGTVDFERIDETIPLGVQAARDAEERLRALSVPREQYAQWRRRVTLEQALDVRVAEIAYEGLERVSADYLAAGATIAVGDVVDAAALGREAQRMGVLRDIESVGYRLDGEAEAARLVWMPVEKPIGPDYVRFDLGLHLAAGGDVAFSLYADHTRTWITPLGGEWRNAFQLGRENFLRSSLYLPLDISQRYFVEPALFGNLSDENIYSGDDRIARYRFGEYGGELEFGANLSGRMQARLGYRIVRRAVSVDTGSPELPEGELADAGLTFSAIYDSRNSRFSPSEGLAVALDYMASDDALGGERDWETAELGLGLTLPILDKDVLWVTAAGGTDLGSDLPPDRTFALGGPGSFPGYEIGQLRADQYWTAGTGYLWRIKEMIALRDEALYLGARVQAGRVVDRLDGLPDRNIYGGSLYLSGRTIIGPLTIGVGRASGDAWSVWLAVGRPIGHGTILERGIFR
jgi:NTE family protein